MSLARVFNNAAPPSVFVLNGDHASVPRVHVVLSHCTARGDLEYDHGICNGTPPTMPLLLIPYVRLPHMFSHPAETSAASRLPRRTPPPPLGKRKVLQSLLRLNVPLPNSFCLTARPAAATGAAALYLCAQPGDLRGKFWPASRGKTDRHRRKPPSATGTSRRRPREMASRTKGSIPPTRSTRWARSVTKLHRCLRSNQISQRWQLPPPSPAPPPPPPCARSRRACVRHGDVWRSFIYFENQLHVRSIFHLNAEYIPNHSPLET